MTILPQLRKLAEAATPANEYADPPMAAHMALVAALSPSVVLAMIECIEAGKAMRKFGSPREAWAFDAALAKLEQERGR